MTETAQRVVCNKMIAATERNTSCIYFLKKRVFKCKSILINLNQIIILLKTFTISVSDYNVL